MCQADSLRIYVSLHKTSGTFEFYVAQELAEDCLTLEHEELSSYSNGPSDLAEYLTRWIRQQMAAG